MGSWNFNPYGPSMQNTGATGWTGMVNGAANPTAAAGVNLFGQMPTGMAVKRDPMATGAALGMPGTPVGTSVPWLGAGAGSTPNYSTLPAGGQQTTKEASQLPGGYQKRSTIPASFYSGYVVPPDGRTRRSQASVEPEVTKADSGWADRYAGDVVREAQKNQERGNSSNIPGGWNKQQLSNMLANGSYKDLGMTYEEVLAAYNSFINP
jgi:hypothetical protein